MLRELRERKGLTQEDLAHEARVDRTYVSILERGRRQPTLRILFSMADALGTSPAEIVGSVARLVQSGSGASRRRS